MWFERHWHIYIENSWDNGTPFYDFYKLWKSSPVLAAVAQYNDISSTNLGNHSLLDDIYVMVHFKLIYVMKSSTLKGITIYIQTMNKS